MDLVYPQPQCIDSLGESFSDYEIVCKIAERLGLLQEYTGGLSIPEIIRQGYETSGSADKISWEELQREGLLRHLARPRLGGASPPASSSSTRIRKKHPLSTPTGKLEFYSTGLAEHFPDDEERPPVPKWIPQGASHQETIGTERSKKYPLLVMSNHPRWGVHSQHDDVTWFREIETCKVRGADGYQYHPLWMHPAGRRGAGHQERRRGRHLQRAGDGAGRGLRDPAHHARVRWASTTGPSTTPSKRGDRPGRGHQHHRPAQLHVQEHGGHGGLGLLGRRWRRPTWRRCGPSIPRPSPGNAT